MRIVVNFVIMLLILHTYAAFSQPEPGVIEDDSTATIESTSEAIIMMGTYKRVLVRLIYNR
jgi:hypothetical protein